MTDHPQRGRRNRAASAALTIAVCLALAAAAAAAGYFIFTTEPEAETEAATKRTAALVETIRAQRGVYRPTLDVLGVVEPARDIILGPRVAGQITRVEPGFEPGAIVRGGQPLLTIDPADFERAVTMRESELSQVRAELAIERGRQTVARREFELLGEQIDAENRALILREPQIEAVRARILAAEAALQQALLDLDRTMIHAPFDAQILSRSINLGSQVAPGDDLARLVGVDEYWIYASVRLRDLRWIRFQDDERPGARVRISHDAAWGPDAVRRGRVKGLIGSIDQSSRLARVLVAVPDPLARNTEGPPLIIGAVVRLGIEGEPLEDVVRLPREYLRQNDTVWVMADGELDIRDTEVVFEDARYAYVSSGLDRGEHIVTTSLATVADGLPLRRDDDSPDDAGDPARSSLDNGADRPTNAAGSGP